MIGNKIHHSIHVRNNKNYVFLIHHTINVFLQFIAKINFIVNQIHYYIYYDITVIILKKNKVVSKHFFHKFWKIYNITSIKKKILFACFLLFIKTFDSTIVTRIQLHYFFSFANHYNLLTFR